MDPDDAVDAVVLGGGPAGLAAAWYAAQAGRRVVLLTPHRDILEWVQPDWVFDTEAKTLYKEGAETNGKSPGEYPEVGRLVITTGSRRKR